VLVAKITLKKQHKKMDPKQPPKKPVISAKFAFAKKKNPQICSYAISLA